MSDIFISYASEDRARVAPLVAALDAHGWTVFWDQTVPPGLTWRGYIGKALEESRSVVVIWSATSGDKEFVVEEAGDGKRRGVLVPVRIDDIAPPFGFRETQAANLIAWEGDPGHPELRRLVQSLEGMLGVPAASASAERDPGTAASIKPGAPDSAEPEQPRTAAALPSDGVLPERGVPEIPREEPPAARSRKAPVAAVVAVLVLLGAVAGYWLWGLEQARTLQVAQLVEDATQATMAAQLDKAESLLRKAGDIKLDAEAVAHAREALAAAKRQQAEALRPGRVFRDSLTSGGEGPEMVVVSAGNFRMGSEESEGGSDDERPVRTVTFAKPFAVGKFPVTFEEYDRFATAAGRTPPPDENWGRANRPVINVSWQDAVDYAAWLSEQTGKRYRLPSEAEWEYAARAGTRTAYWWGDEVHRGATVMANCDGCGSEWDRRQTAPVGQFEANAFGLHDAHGNVWEWVQDCWHGSYEGAPGDGGAWLEGEGGECGLRVLRGGSRDSVPGGMRSALRYGYDTGDASSYVGFRLAQDL